MSFERDAEGVSPVIGVLLMMVIAVILAAVIGSFVFQANPIKKGVELYFVNVEAHTDGWINCTATGSDNVTISSLKILVNNQFFTPNNTNTIIDGRPHAAGLNDRIHGGVQIAIKSSSGYSSGQNIRLTISDIASGMLLSDLTVKVK